MLKSREHEKLLNALAYFAANVPRCDPSKLGTLLYVLDFTHFRQTGRSVTGLEYFATRHGPLPVMRFEARDAGAPDHVHEPGADTAAGRRPAQRVFDPSHFTRRELRIMETLRERFQSSAAPSLAELEHAERAPWETTWDEGRGNLARIPYALAIQPDDPHAQAIREAAAGYEG